MCPQVRNLLSEKTGFWFGYDVCTVSAMTVTTIFLQARTHQRKCVKRTYSIFYFFPVLGTERSLYVPPCSSGSRNKYARFLVRSTLYPQSPIKKLCAVGCGCGQGTMQERAKKLAILLLKKRKKINSASWAAAIEPVMFDFLRHKVS